MPDLCTGTVETLKQINQYVSQSEEFINLLKNLQEDEKRVVACLVGQLLGPLDSLDVQRICNGGNL